MTDRQVMVALLDARADPQHEAMSELGTKVGKLYTDHGFPIDMALDRLPYDPRRKLLVLYSALHWLVQHRRESGATDKAIDRQRKTNRETVKRFLTTGEAGVY